MNNSVVGRCVKHCCTYDDEPRSRPLETAHEPHPGLSPLRPEEPQILSVWGYVFHQLRFYTKVEFILTLVFYISYIFLTI